jgi:hypothetical protein
MKRILSTCLLIVIVWVSTACAAPTNKPWSALPKQTALIAGDYFPLVHESANYTILWSSILLQIRAYTDNLYFSKIVDPQQGGIVYFDGFNWVSLAPPGFFIGLTGVRLPVLTFNQGGAPEWDLVSCEPTYFSTSTGMFLSASLLAACRQAQIDNFGQTSNINVYLPPANSPPLFFRAVAAVGLSQYWRFTRSSVTPTDKIFLNSSATGKDMIQYVSPVVEGSHFTCFNAKKGSGYAWFCQDGRGTLEASDLEN